MVTRATRPRVAASGPDRQHRNLPVIEMLKQVDADFCIVLPNGERMSVGSKDPTFTVTFRTERALKLPCTELALGNAYIHGEIDLDGDMSSVLSLRDSMRFGTRPSQMLRFAYELLVRSPTRANKRAIDAHYLLGDDFYLTFVDKRYRFYSHCLFESDGDSLEEAAEHKLESMWNFLGLQSGMRLLDIGGGWGGVADYCGARGVHVTSVTLAEDSRSYIESLIRERNLPAEVVVGDFLDFKTNSPFDHAVIYGVIEHIPNYTRFCSTLWDALKPGGRLYLDASATKEKFAISPITRKFTWTGHHSFLSLPDMVREQLFHGFEIIDVARETHDYELTITRWAERFEAARTQIVDRWGEETYRTFQIFLWGGAHAFRTNRLQAYHLVTERREDPGPRPGLVRRFGGFVGSLV